MALYQPTNIFPDLKNGLAEGTVDATQDLKVQWQINGPSAMTSFVITIYANDSASTQKYTTGTKSAGCPAYGADNLGNPVPFSYTIPAATLASSGITNGNEYKIIIRQNYSGGYVVQTSASVFQTMAEPTFTVSGYDPTVPSTYTITNRTHTFSFLTFSDANLQWFRWVLYTNVNYIEGTETVVTTTPTAGRVVRDTGKVYGTGDTSFTYNGFDDKLTEVCVQCTACDSCGRIVTSDLYGFKVDYEFEQLDFPIETSAYTEGSAIQVQWSGTKYIPGVPTGRYELNDNTVTLPNPDSVIRWNTINEEPMDFPADWIFLYRGQLKRADALMFALTTSDGTDDIRMVYDLETRSLDVYDGANNIGHNVGYEEDNLPVNYEADIIVALRSSGTDMTLVVATRYLTGGLYPSETLHPGETVYPSESTVFRYTWGIREISDVVGTNDIQEIRIGGIQECHYAQLFIDSDDTWNAISENVTWVMEGDTPHGNFDYDGMNIHLANGMYYVTDFSKGIDAGTLTGYVNLSGWKIYRMSQYEDFFRPIATLPIATMWFRDYTARTDGELYTYEVAPMFDTDKIGAGIRTAAPFGILGWNYSLIEAIYDEKMEGYRFIAEYLFGKNLQSGDVSNNNTPGIQTNFTRYPTVQLSNVNYKSGTLTSLIGQIKLGEDGTVKYTDTRKLRDDIYALSTTKNPLFLKTRKGDIFEIRISAPITMALMDETKEQALTATISWVEVDNADEKYILDFGA